MEKQKYEVVCLTHGVIGVIGQALLGLSLFDAHRLTNEGCAGMFIQPQGVDTWKKVDTFGSGVIEAKGNDRRIVTKGLPTFEYKVK